MPGNDIDSAVADAELLSKGASEALAPAVHAEGVPTECELVAVALQPVAQIVVVSIAHALVEKPDLVKGAREVGGVGRAHVVHKSAVDLRVAMLGAPSGPSPPE